jgi:CubicO group peptidase (beta-lactamase class C family)
MDGRATRRTAILGAVGAHLVGAAPHAFAAEAHGGKAGAILEAVRSRDAIPAISAAAARGGGVIWAGALGRADLEQGIAASPRSRFRIGSVSKAVTATLAARLTETAGLDLSSQVGRYIDGLPSPLASATLLQLLTHQSGVRHYIPRDFDSAAPGGPIDLRNYPSAKEMLAIFIEDPLIHPPGAGYTYSTFGYSLAGLAMERATGRDFAELLRSELAGPLALTSLGPDRLYDLEPDRVRPYEPAKGYLGRMPDLTGAVINAPSVNAAYKRPGGGLLASAQDLARFGSALLRPGYLSDSARAHLFRPVVPASLTRTGFAQALGWRIDRDTAGRLRHHHSGGLEGGRASVVLFPEQDLAVALTSNLGGHPGDPLTPLGEIASQLHAGRGA